MKKIPARRGTAASWASLGLVGLTDIELCSHGPSLKRFEPGLDLLLCVPTAWPLQHSTRSPHSL